ncbi:MAG TPA: glycosyltransferase family 4 protein [Chloroflexota bacterium]|nr:glycosyltransferase family 4 protein [Chloroflexota bacterium]
MGILNQGQRERSDAGTRSPRKAACVIAQSRLIWDARARREAEILLSEGWTVDLMCLREPGGPWLDRWNQARVLHLPGRRHHGSKLFAYLVEYLTFFTSATLCVSLLTLRRRYTLIHVHNLPDFLVFAATIPRLLGARVLLDIRDPVPDLYLSKFGGDPGRFAVRAARWIERVSTTFADHVLAPGEPSRQRLLGRGVPADKVTNILNSADPRLFRPDRHAVDRGHFTLVYHGSLFKRNGVDLVVRAVHQLRREIPELRLIIAGEGEEADYLKHLVEQLDLSEQVVLAGSLPLERTVELVGQADLGVAPYRQDTFTDLVYPTKSFECIAMGIPVIMSRLAGIADLFPDVPDVFVQPGEVAALAERIRQLYQDPERLRRLNEALQHSYAPYAWEGQRRTFLALVGRLVNRQRRAASS